MKKVILLFLLSIFCIACLPNTREDEQVNSIFQGKYAGTFSGIYSGDMGFEIYKNGNIRGEIVYRDSNVKETIFGNVNMKGQFNITTNTYFTMSGFIKDKTKGMWRKNNETGEFYFYKLQ